MKLRERSMRQDWLAVIAEGDITYSDGITDNWDEICHAISGADNDVPIVRNHGYEGQISKISDFQLDQVNKLVKARFNAPISQNDAVSVAWKEENGHIVGIDHVAIGNFTPECPQNICNITRNRSQDPKKFKINVNNMNKEEEEVPNGDNDNTTDEPEETESDVDYKVLYDELRVKVDKFEEFLKKQEIEEEEIDLTPNKDVQNDIKTSFKTGKEYDPWNIARNTTRINNIRGK